jgi:serine/threonine protein kinase
VDLLQRCFIWDPERRVTAEDALTHPVFKEVR